MGASTDANAKAKDLFDRQKIAADKAKLALVRAQAEAKEARQAPKPDGQAQAQRLDAAGAKSASEAADKQVLAAQQAEQKRVVENETKKINVKKAIREKADPKVVDSMTKAAQRQAEKLAQAKAETADAETKQSVKAQKAKEKQEEANGTETKEAIKQVEAANQEVVREEKDLQKVKEKKAAGVEKGEEAQKSEESADQAKQQAEQAFKKAVKANLKSQAAQAGEMVSVANKVVAAAKLEVLKQGAAVTSAEEQIKIAAVAKAKAKASAATAEQKAKTQAQGLEAKADEAKKLNAPKNFKQNLQQAQALAASAEADRLRAEKKVMQGKVNLITANVKSKKEEIAQLEIKSKGDKAKGNAAAVKAAE